MLKSGEDEEAPADVLMPEIHQEFGYLLGLFFDSGQGLATGMGLIPLTWTEINSWINVNKLELTLWEIETIKKMSEAYCAEYSRATEPNRPQPYTAPVQADEEIDEEVFIEAKMREALSWRKTIRGAGKKKE